tara:strand:- start:899 stop:1177 length:279 start_codon:yes stop_codon:yes gene_type:complete
MDIDYGTVTASGQISSSSKGIKSIEFHARSGNEKSVIVGRSNASLTNGREIPPGETHAPNFDKGSVPFSTWYAVFEQPGDMLDWTIIIGSTR